MRRSRSARSRRGLSNAATLLLCLGVAAGDEDVFETQHNNQVKRQAVPQRAAPPYKGLAAYGFFDVGQDCTPSPLWFKEVNAASYELGCREIEDILDSEPKLVGEGRVRRVYVTEHEGRSVAVKELRQPGSVRLHRIEMVTLDAVRGNPNFVQLLGVCNTTIVTEAFSTDIQSAVRNRPGVLPLLDAVGMSLDGARALQALHETGIVHYDIKPPQMLVALGGQDSDRLRVKLNDFNVAFFMSTAPDGSPCPFRAKGALQFGPWRTPEYLSQKPMTEKVDIYRMGLVFKKFLANGGVHEVDSFADFQTMEHRSYNKIIQDMTEDEPQRRPSAREIAVRLEALLQDIS